MGALARPNPPAPPTCTRVPSADAALALAQASNRRYITPMKDLLDFLVGLGPQHWLVFGLALLIAEMATGTTYILWPAVAALITSLLALVGVDNGFVQIGIFAALTVLLTAFGHPIVKNWR